MANNLEQPVFYTAGVQAAQQMQHPSPAGGIVLRAPTIARHTNRSTSLLGDFSPLCSAGGEANEELPPGL